MEDYRVAKLAAVVLRKDRSVVYCKHCQAAYLDGPEKCPRCKNVLVAASTLEPEKKAEVKATIVEKAPKPCIYQEGERCWIRFRGQALPIESWCGKLGIGVDFLRQCIRRRKDITSLLLGNRPTKVNDLPDLEEGKKEVEKEERRGPIEGFDVAKVQIVNKDDIRKRRFRITYMGKTKSASWWSSHSGCNYQDLLGAMLTGQDVTSMIAMDASKKAVSDEVYASASAVELMGNPRSEVEELPNPKVWINSVHANREYKRARRAGLSVATAEVVATAALTVVNHGSDDPIHVSILRGKLARFDTLKAEILKRREELVVLEKERDRLVDELKEVEQ